MSADGAPVIRPSGLDPRFPDKEAWFRTMADTVPVLIWMSGEDKGGVFFNARWLDFTGRSLEEELGEGWLEHIHPDDVDTGLGPCAAAFARHGAFTTQFRMRRHDGVYRWMLDSGVPRFSPDGHFLGYIGSCIDITERREAEEKVLSAEHQLETITDALPALVAYIDASERYRFINKTYEAFLGRSRSEICGLHLSEVLGAEVYAALRPRVLAALAGETVVFEDEMRAQGEPRWMRASYIPYFGASAAPEGYVALVVDWTQEKRTEVWRCYLAEASALLASSFDYETTLQALAQLVVPRLADLCLVEVLRDGQYDPGKPLAMAHVEPEKAALVLESRRRHPPDLDSASGVPHVLRTNRSEMFSELKDPTLILGAQGFDSFELQGALEGRSAMIVPLSSGSRAIGAITFLSSRDRRYDSNDVERAEDLARRASMAIQNAELYAKAQEAIKKRDDFLSMASHELKTPLTSMQLQVQALKRAAERGDLDPDRVGARVQRIDVQVHRLTQLVNELLEVARIAAGWIALRPAEMDLVALAQQVIERFEEESHRTGSALRLKASGAVRGTWDRERIDQVLTNLLSNALKYGEGQPIDVSIEDGREVVIQVVDRGLGIAPEDQARIFDRFERAVPSSNFGGLGLGLWIAQEVVRAHGGRITVESALGSGATFRVELPREAATTG